MEQSTLLISGLGSLAAATVISLFMAYMWWKTPRERQYYEASPRDMRFLLHDGLLIDASDGGKLVLGVDSCRGLTWDDLRDTLILRFPNIPRIPPDDTVEIEANEGEARLVAERQGERIAVWLRDRPPAPQIGTWRRHCWQSWDRCARWPMPRRS
ncbi:MAG: hypothetical protein KDK26_04030 [Roseivivax sp.]|nr:hypothetical protein [Roseivivax sp.]